MLDCCSPLEVVRLEGLTLDDFACEARCNGAKVSVTRILNPEDDADVAKFREDVKEVCKSSEKKLVISYNRSTLLQTGTGHFSPIGGYHEKSDHVLILDVARFKYPPHWVPLPLLVKSMSTIDPATGLTRGYVVMSKSSQQMSAVLRVSVGRSQWKQFADAYRATFQFRLKKAGHQYISIEQYVEMACKIIVEVQIMEYLVAYVESFDALAEEHRNYIEAVFSQIAKTKLMQAISSLPKPCCPSYSKHGYKEIATIFILAQGPIGLDILDESTISGSATELPSMNGTVTHSNGSDASSDSECASKNSQNVRERMKSTIEELRSIFDEVLPEHMSNEVSALRSTLRAIERSCACRIQAETDSSNPNRGCRQ
jgi:hypothetical protein